MTKYYAARCPNCGSDKVSVGLRVEEWREIDEIAVRDGKIQYVAWTGNLLHEEVMEETGTYFCSECSYEGPASARWLGEATWDTGDKS